MKEINYDTLGVPFTSKYDTKPFKFIKKLLPLYNTNL